MEHGRLVQSQKRPAAPARASVTASNPGNAAGPGFGVSVQLIPNAPPRSANPASVARPSVVPVVRTRSSFSASAPQPATP